MELLGKGGMGAVYKARQKSLDRVVALKVLPPSAAKDESFIRRFISEARTVAKLNHENIIAGIDVGDADGTYYFAMEHVEGTSLAKLIERDGPMPEKRALEIAVQMGRALEHAHKHGLVHRDVKPQNILVAKNDVAKLCDLGLAKQMDKGTKSITSTDMGVPLGTPHYLSPEQARGEADVDIRSDIYSLGASLYHMLTGVPPFEGQSPMVLMTKHLTEEPIPPRRRNEEVSKAASDLVLTMMEKEKERRHQNPTELLDDLGRVLSGKKAKGGPPAKKKKSHSDDDDDDEPKKRARSVAVRDGGPSNDKMPMVIAAFAMVGVIAILIVAMSGGNVFGPGRESAPIQREAQKAYEKADGLYRTALGGGTLDEYRPMIRQKFQSVIDTFPNTDAADAARKRLEELH
ncbi:serine/threonine protein kinase [bacterium]|nr:serine/threonine protein kinase [bacterium]